MSTPPKIPKLSPDKIELQITDLNDDCLIEICNYLCIEDLVSAFDLCKRFRYAAGVSFSARYKEIRFECLTRQRFRINPPQGRTEISEVCLRKMFENFGQAIKAIELNGEGSHSKLRPVIRYANQFCSENMKSLKISYCKDYDGSESRIPRRTFDDCQHLFEHLEALRIDCRIGRNCFEWCDNVKLLSFFRSKSQIKNPLLFRIYPKLESVDCGEYFTSPEELYEFLKNHPNLKELEIYRGELLTAQNVGCIPDLEKLTFILDDESLEKTDWIKIFQLKKLKCLRIYYSPFSQSELISKMLSGVTSKVPTNIETLELFHFCTEDIYAFLNTFTYPNLKTISFKFICGFNDSKTNAFADLINIIRKLNTVEELRIFGFQYTRIRQIVLLFVRNLTNLKKLHLYICEYAGICVELKKLNEVQKAKKSMLTVFYAGATAVMEGIIKQDSSSDSSLNFLTFTRVEYPVNN